MSITAPDQTDAAVAFVVPVYNKAKALPPVLAALAAQRGDFARRFIFVDDGSTDTSARLLEEFAARNAGRTLIIRQENAGSARATNVGIAAATEPFVKFCDADDILEPDATLRLLDALRADSSAVLAFGDRRSFAELAEISADPLPDEGPPARRMEAPLGPALRNSLFNPSQLLARRDALVAAGGCDERVVHSQEYSLSLRLAGLGPFLHLPRRVAWVLDAAEGRLSNDNRRQLQRVTRAIALFLADHPELPRPLQREAWRRSVGRIWKYHRRCFGAAPLSSWHRQTLLAYLPLFDPPDYAAAIARCADGFDDLPADPSPGNR